jgi:MFS family permease
MTIYAPLYLAHVAGFSWNEIGLILFVALSAYVIFEYPVGIIADKYLGEKEMMLFGFVVLIASSAWLAFLPGSSIGVWMIALFLTRAGASFVEATSESYFFKHTQSMDVHKISLFRMTRPLSSVIGAVVGSIALLYMEFNMLFILLGLLLIPGLFFSFLIKDTR